MHGGAGTEVELIEEADRLLALLDEEHALLRDLRSEELAATAQRKLAALQAFDARVREAGLPLSGALAERVAALRRANTRNAALLFVRRRFADAALEALRGGPSAPVYGAQGTQARSEAGRLLGTA